MTGGTGFVGAAFCRELHSRGFEVRAAVRLAGSFVENAQIAIVGTIDATTDWNVALRDVDLVVHLAARVHVMSEEKTDPLNEYRCTNTVGSENLARCAAKAGVKRLVYVSTIKVNGENTSDGRSFTELGSPLPQDPYGISKWEAELALHRVAAETGLEIVIARPPLVYGPEVKGNFAQMLKVLAMRVPLPLASAHNQRSLIYVENLVDALLACAIHPAAAGQIYLVSDGEDVSTPDLLRRLGDAMHRPARLFPVPPGLLKLAGGLFGKAEQTKRLLESLRVDSGKIRRELNWTPPYTLQQGLQKTAEWYRNAHL